MKHNEMTNLFIGIEKTHSNPFKVAIVADDIEAAQRIANGYALDSGFENQFEVTDEIVDCDFDCDYILTEVQKCFNDRRISEDESRINENRSNRNIEDRKRSDNQWVKFL